MAEEELNQKQEGNEPAVPNQQRALEMEELQEAVESTPPDTPEEKPPSRLRSIGRTVFRFTAGILIVFGLGMVFSFFMFQQPRVNELSERVDTLQAENQDLAGQIASLEQEVAGLEAVAEEYETLQAEFAVVSRRQQVLALLSSVRAAQVELQNGEVEAARSRLADLPAALETLAEDVSEATQAEIESMLNRTSLILDEVDSDLFAALSDLEVLANSLEQLDEMLSRVP